VFVTAELVNLALALRAAILLRRRWLMPWAALMPVYFGFGVLSMWKALIELWDRPYYWDKTLHGEFGGAAEDQPPDAPVLAASSRSRVSNALEM